jgi:capsular exopolysaccharide synthesis family protein
MSEDVGSFDLVRADSPALQSWDRGGLPSATVPRPPLERARGAIRRYRWLILGVVGLATLGGFFATKLVHPVYDVAATIWIQAETPMAQKTGAIRSDELLNEQAWVALLKSPKVADGVVLKLALYLRPDNPADSSVFRGFTIGDRFNPGKYTLKIDRARQRWQLAMTTGALADSGAASDSVGRKGGFRWVLPSSSFEGLGERKIDFTVATPRETAVDYINRLGIGQPDHSSFLTVGLRDENPQLAARTINTWITDFVNLAAELKKQNVKLYAEILNDQLTYAENQLHGAEAALSGFQIKTITLPSEGGPVAPGVEQTRDPVMRNFFDQKIEYDALRHDRESLEKIIDAAQRGQAQYDAVLFLPSVNGGAGAAALRDALNELHSTKAKLSNLRLAYTNEFQGVKDLASRVDLLEKQSIPQLTNELLSQLKDRETQYERRIAGAGSDLQAIPPRYIEEMRLRRQVSVDERLYTDLKGKFAEAQLAEKSTTPDLSILDSAVAPLHPSKNTAPRLMAMAILGGLGAAIALALLLDMIDRRIRYSEQVTNELGLAIAAAIPRFPKGGVSARSPEQIAHLVESFRTLRMHVRHACEPPITIAISSPSPGDGKSFVAANLAMSFADAGFRTVLVDGDTRRGMVHEVFGLGMGSGLTEFLSGRVDFSQVVHETTHDRLSLVPCGTRQPHSPELLTSAALPRLVAELKTRYDVVVFDTPPLAAGVDAYAIAAALNNLLVVVRIGKTERRMAAAKLILVDRLPINVLGAVLNGVNLKGEFDYYGYASGYGFTDAPVESETTEVQVT